MSKNPQKKLPKAESYPKLQKFLAENGLCSRRKGEELIRNGEVSVNGETASIGSRVNPLRDVVRVGNKRIQAKIIKPLVFAVNKPRGFTCSNEDPHAQRLIFELLETKHRSLRLFCAGRLDVDSEGLVILTNNGKLANRLTHPSHQIKKKYQVEINQPLDKEDFQRLLEGFEEDGEFLQLDEIRSKSGHPIGSTRLEIFMGHGKKREIRRCFDNLRYRVKKIKKSKHRSNKFGQNASWHIPRVKSVRN